MDRIAGKNIASIAARAGVRALLAVVTLASAVAAQAYTLKWQDNSANETGFRVERAGTDGAFRAVATVGANVTSYVDSTASAGSAYQYRVTAVTASGATPFSNIAAPPSAPTISAIPNQNTTTGKAVGPIAFTVADANTPAGNLTLTGRSSNTTLVPNSGIRFGGSGGNRTVTVQPSAGRTGTASITLTVSDGALARSVVFTVNVTATATTSPAAPSGGNTAPTISQIADQTIPQAAWTGALPFTIGDAQTAASSLILRATSSDTTLLPLVGITFGGTGSKRTVSARPTTTRSGVVTVTVIVSDGTLTTSEAFKVTVQPTSTRTFSAMAAPSTSEAVASNPDTGAATVPENDAVVDLTRVGTVTAGQPLTAEFSVESTSETFLVRAVGPGLARVGARGTLAAPRIRILNAAGKVVHESGAWGGDAKVAAAGAQLGKLPLVPNSADAAVLVTLPRGSYRAQAVTSKGSSGIVLLEVAELVNASAVGSK